MSTTLNISIAGITFSVLSADKTAVITPPPDPAYNQFTLPSGKDRTDIRVTVYPEPDSIPKSDNCTLIFEGGEAWRLFRCGDGYLLNLKLPGARAPLWTIRADPAFTELTAHCHPSIVKTTNDYCTIPSPITYPLDQIILIHHLAHKGGLIVHCAGLEYNGRVSVFPGQSGAGKSSVSRLLRSAAGVSVLSDDRIVIRKANQRFIAHGTPWPGEAKIAINRKADLGHMFFLTRATSNRVQPLTPDQALERLLPVASIPWYDENHLPGVLDFCDDLLQSTSVFDLQFTLENKLMDTLADFLPG
jgi:hypothetical protein